MSVGENIRRYRKSRGMTQAQLAEAVGLTEGAVRHYESGIRAVKPELLESISAALGVSVNALKDYGVEIASGPLVGVAARAVVVLDDQNRVLHSELVPEIKNEPDYDAAIKALG